MSLRQLSVPFCIRLFLVTAVIALVMAALLVFELAQRKSLLEQNAVKIDSLSAPAFILDSEFQRFQHALQLHLDSRQPVSKAELQTRLDLLSSKVDTVRDAPGSAYLFKNPENVATFNIMQTYVQRAQHELDREPSSNTELRLLLADMQNFFKNNRTLGNSADLIASLLMEQQNAELLSQNQQITWLTLLQLVVLMATAAGLLYRHRSLQREKAALTALNEQLRQAQQDAESASRGKSLFLANMSHELRTPFNGIVGMLGVLAKTPLTQEQIDLVHTVNDSADHFLKLLNDILDMSALESGKMSLHTEAVDLASLMLNVEAIMRPLAVQKNLSISLHNLPDEALWVKSDGTRLRQILLNLLNNAIKFTQQGEVSLHFHHSSDEGQARFFEFTVSDTGIGLDKTSMSKLFQLFYQVDSGLSRKSSGIGLGLEISMALARLLGGDIHVQSQPGQGSSFTVRMPWVPMPAPVVEDTGTEQVIGIKENETLRVLVAEDHPVNQKFLAFLLQQLGHHATFCENGELALQALDQQDFDVVLMDIHMPVMDGLTATRAIRSMACQKAQIPVIALTADVFKETRENAVSAGINAFIAKPVQLKELQKALVVHVYQQQTQTTLTPANAS